MNQASKILNHLMKYGSLSSSEAGSRYQIKNLSARIKGLRYLGLNITYSDGKYRLQKWRKPKRARVLMEDDLFPNYDKQ